jgi:glycosyltransferase involved in cell wall biosynthesis
MMHLFINSLAASAGGGLTYVRNVLPLLAETEGLGITVALSSGLREEFRTLSSVEFLELEVPPARRFWYEQSVLPGLIRRSGANVLLSAGNFAVRKSPVPQILLSRNSIYTSPDFYRDLLSRREYRMWLDTRMRAMIAKRSVNWADVTVAPSEAFAAELTRWTGKGIKAIHHGFDRDAFTQDSNALEPDVQSKLLAAEGALRILFVSHYNYYRNFETLIRALPRLRDRLVGRPIRLLLTCRLAAAANPGAYRPQSAAKLIEQLGVRDMVLELGSIPYHRLHHLYSRADLYVSPAYTETFAHPLVEAMASGLPVIASDLPLHREICSDAAAYFPRFSSGELAATIAELASSPETLARMAARGLTRSRQFSWREHVRQILDLCTGLTEVSRNESRRLQERPS